jgi:hypothetical protein
MIRVCGDPGCSAVFHNCTTKDKYCLDCGCRTITINQDTYEKKFKWIYFQYDMKTGEYLRPEPEEEKPGTQLTLFE